MGGEPGTEGGRIVRAGYTGGGQASGADAEWGATGRQGPEAVSNDSWDAPRVGDSARYHGRRRASTVARRWVALTVALVAIAGTLTLAATLGSSGDAPAPTATAVDGTHWPTDTASTSPSGTPTTSPSSPTPTATQSAGTGTATPFAAIAFEAEAGSPVVTLSGSARVQADSGASGGKIVSGLGASGQGQAPGALRVNNVTIPSAGTYVISIYYTNTDNPGVTSALVSVSGAKAVTVKFTGARSCCGLRQVEITLAAGVHTITISNPAEAAPSVDKIAVSRPA